jgi:hypothetical protein
MRSIICIFLIYQKLLLPGIGHENPLKSNALPPNNAPQCVMDANISNGCLWYTHGNVVPVDVPLVRKFTRLGVLRPVQNTNGLFERKHSRDDMFSTG